MTNQKKDLALTALISSNSLTEAAQSAGIDRRTLYNYLHNDLDFARAYDEIRDRQAIAYFDELINRRERALEIIMRVMEDEEQGTAIRLRAAQMVLAATENQEQRVKDIQRQNISANKDLLDLSVR
ncbi:MAG: hypothetical protein IKP22_03190 [Clostridia bacterium]|nr:hypothetical protein [Clostridia bacterium]